MNILAINNFNITPLKHNQNNNVSYVSMPRFGLVMPKPLSKDTVSFGATAAKAITKRGGASIKVCSQAEKVAEDLQPQFEKFLKKLFAPLLVTIDNPNNVVADIKGRFKSKESIKEKTESNNLESLQDIFDYLTDLNGCKIVLRDGSKDAVKKVLDILLSAITMGALIPVEIDNKRPIAAVELAHKEQDKYDYSASKYLEKFARAAAKESGRELFTNPDESVRLDTRELLHSDMLHFIPYNYHRTNYPALHFLFKFPGQKRVFELQIMGLDVSAYKDLDDKLYKILNNKNVPAEFQELEDVVLPYNITEEKELIKPFDTARAKIKELEKENVIINRKLRTITKKVNLSTPERVKVMKLKAILEKNNQEIEHEKAYCLHNAEMIKSLEEKIEKGNAFNLYRAEVFLSQREKEPRPYDKKRRSYFTIPRRSDIPDMNELYDIYLRCNKKYEARKAAEAKAKEGSQAAIKMKKS